MEDLLVCSICFDVLVDPVVGPCGHDYCVNCIQTWYVEEKLNERCPKCPQCRNDLPEDASTLPICFRLKSIIERLFPDKATERRKEVDETSVVRNEQIRSMQQMQETPIIIQQEPPMRGRRRLRRGRAWAEMRQQEEVRVALLNFRET